MAQMDQKWEPKRSQNDQKIDQKINQTFDVFFDRCFGRFCTNVDAKMEPNADQSRRQNGPEHEKASIA